MVSGRRLSADYTRHTSTSASRRPGFAELLKIDDPYFYRDRLTLPKFIVNSAGDQYFPPDSSKFYFDDLKGSNTSAMSLTPNHSLADSDARESMLAFYHAILKGTSLPQFSWKVQDDGTIRVQTKDKPREVNLWQATNPKARDFRLVSIGKAYEKSALASQGEGVYVAKVQPPRRLDRVFRRVRVRQRREGSLQVHHPGPHRSRQVAAQHRGDFVKTIK